MRMRKKILGAAMALSLGALMLFPVPASAAEGTEGSEMQVLQAEQLEIQLGSDWAGVEFELKTDAGMYPGTIPVGEDGVLRLEIGGSSSYILTCLNSAVAVPDPTQAPATTEESQEENADSDGNAAEAETGDPQSTGEKAENNQNAEQETEVVSDVNQESEDSPAADNEGKTVAGIPVLHLALFGGGMVLAIGSLIVMYVMKRRRALDADYDEDDEE